MDGLGGLIQARQPPLDHWRSFVYCTSLDGQILGAVNHIHSEDLTSNRSPTSVAHFSQNRLLPLLLENASKSALPGSHMLMGYECVNVRPSSNEVTATLSPSGSTTQKPVSCQYLVAADGAGSGIRKSMGVRLQGEHNMQQLISVHFTSKKLSSYLVGNRPAMLYFVFNQNAIAVVVAHDLRSGEFIAQLPFYPPQQTAEEFTPDFCSRIIRQLVEMDIDVDIKTVRPWIMHAEVANKYVCGEGRVFLAGDAAHRFPPAGGFGMNTGIQDAHNLAWKVSAVLKGLANPALLKTYETERRPVAQANTTLSVANFKAAMSIPAALGLDPSYARMVHESMNSVGAILPKTFQSTILKGVLSMGRAQVSPWFLNKHNPVAQARLAEVDKILQQGKSLQLQFPAEDLLFRYTNGALVPESSDDATASTAERRRDCVPSSVTGVRLPHMSIKVAHGTSGSENISSTLDLVDGKRVEFLLFVECSKSGISWASDALQVPSFPLKIVLITDENSQSEQDKRFIEDWKSKNAEAYTEVVGTDGRKWWEVCGVPQSGVVLLVRPDDHIAWRSQSLYSSESTEELKSVFKTIHN